jgi:hypothetical protein
MGAQRSAGSSESREQLTARLFTRSWHRVLRAFAAGHVVRDAVESR